MSGGFVHEQASIEDGATVGDGCYVWDLARIRSGAEVGAGTVIGRGAFIDRDVTVGAGCKIQNNALVYFPARLAEGVFIGPSVVLTNDRYPRAMNPDGSQKDPSDWQPSGVVVDRGASVGAAAVVIGGVRIGAWSVVAAGSVVTRDVAPHALVAGAPARRLTWVGRAGHPLSPLPEGVWQCPVSGERYHERDDQLVGPA